MDWFLWILLISVLISNIDTAIPHPQNFPASPAICQISPSPTDQFPYFVLPYKTTRHNYWIYQSICRAKPIKFIIKLYTNHNTLLVKPQTYQKAESLRVATLSKLDNTVNKSSIFNTKWFVLFHFHNTACAYSHPYNLHQKSVPPLQL